MAYTQAHKVEYRKKQVAEASEKLVSGIKSLVASEDWERYLKKQAEFCSYSFRNVMLIMQQCEYATKVAGFRQWKKLHKRWVKKGEKSIKILAPMFSKIKDESGDDDTVLNGFMTVGVFDVSQTEGDQLPTVANLLTGEVEKEHTEILKHAAEKNGYTVESKDLNGSTINGWCDYSSRELVLNKSRSSLQKTKTLVHEITHMMLHVRQDGEPHSRKTDEVEAESVAFIVMQSLGYDTSDYSFGYVASWSGGDLSVVEEVGERVAKTAKKILEDFDIRD